MSRIAYKISVFSLANAFIDPLPPSASVFSCPCLSKFSVSHHKAKFAAHVFVSSELPREPGRSGPVPDVGPPVGRGDVVEQPDEAANRSRHPLPHSGLPLVHSGKIPTLVLLRLMENFVAHKVLVF